jgi:hypothetical protein
LVEEKQKKKKKKKKKKTWVCCRGVGSCRVS